MAGPKKLKPNAVTGGVEVLTTLARAHGSAKPGLAGASYKLSRQPSQLRENDLLIAVVHRDSVAVQTVRTGALPRGRGAHTAMAGYLAKRLAEIEAAVGEMLSTGARGSAEPGGLTADEERVLASGGFDPSPLRAGEEEPLLRAALEYARLLQSSLSVEQAASVLGVNPSRVRQRLGGDPRSLYGIKEGKSWRVPKFQFIGRKPIPGMAEVLPALPRDLHPVEVQRWFSTPHPDLYLDPDERRPVAPLDWLRMGRPAEVVADLARNL